MKNSYVNMQYNPMNNFDLPFWGENMVNIRKENINICENIAKINQSDENNFLAIKPF